MATTAAQKKSGRRCYPSVKATIVNNHTPRLKASLATAFLTLLLIFGLTADLLYGQTGRGRVISIHNIHTKETLTITYKKNGQYIPSAMKKINHIMRDWRRNESRVMRKDLIDLMWEIHNQLGSRKPIYLISGYRSLKTNNKLRKTRGGQARRSRHILGMAADMHFPDIPVRELRDSALIRQKGGVGYYPTSGLPFVHVDVGRVRHWPRLARPQLAKLFPNGRSKHIPRGGRPLTKADARKYGAAAYLKKLRTIQLARRLRRDKQPGTAIAALSPKNTPPTLKKTIQPNTQPPLDKLALEKQLAALENVQQQPFSFQKPKAPIKKTPAKKEKTAPWWRGQSIAALEPLQTKIEEERAFVQLAAIDTNVPKSWHSFKHTKPATLIDEANLAHSPAFDDEHPEETNYRAFSLSPLMTDQPIADDQNLTKISPVEYAQTSILMANDQILQSARFRPGLQHAHLKWANQFIGSALPENNPAINK